MLQRARAGALALVACLALAAVVVAPAAVWAVPASVPVAVSAAPASASVASAAASPAPAVALQAGLTPDRLGESTTVSIGFRIAAAPEQLPSPLTSFDVRLPVGMGLAAATIGLTTCPTSALLSHGVGGCSEEARMGLGSAAVAAALGPQLVEESAPVTILMGQPIAGHTTLLFYFEGRAPVIAPLVFPSEVLSSADSLSSEFDTAIPPIPVLPGTPDVSILSLRANIGPNHLIYHRRVRGRLVGYRPIGMSVPSTCPPGGFVFAGVFGFQDGAHASARSTVPCPRRARSGRR